MGLKWFRMGIEAWIRSALYYQDPSRGKRRMHSGCLHWEAWYLRIKKHYVGLSLHALGGAVTFSTARMSLLVIQWYRCSGSKHNSCSFLYTIRDNFTCGSYIKSRHPAQFTENLRVNLKISSVTSHAILHLLHSGKILERHSAFPLVWVEHAPCSVRQYRRESSKHCRKR